MLRYNQGFKRLGPMEQCSSGEWVRWDDVVANVNQRDEAWQAVIEGYQNQHKSLISSAESLKDCCDAYKNIVDKQYGIIRQYMLLCFASVSMFAILVIDLVSKAL